VAELCKDYRFAGYKITGLQVIRFQVVQICRFTSWNIYYCFLYIIA